MEKRGGMNRLTRDQIIQHALDLIDSGQLDQHDRPAGIVHEKAYCLRWLQNGLDYFSHAFPWQYDVTETNVTLNTGTLSLPTDFILDVKDGLWIPGDRRLLRRSIQELLDLAIQGRTQKPVIYAVMGNTLRVEPKPDKAYAAKLWYYALPARLQSCDIPRFPSDWVLVEYLRLRGLEWLRAVPVGSAMTYAKELCAQLKRDGLGGEPEYTSIPLDPYHFSSRSHANDNAWMGVV